MRSGGPVFGLRHALFLIGALLAFGRGAAAENSCVTAQCHATLLAPKDVHPPTDGCDSCHESTASPHPQQGKKTFTLTQEVSELCTACHDDKAHFPHTHGPVSAGSCTSCHDPHASDIKPLLLKKDDELCAGCHADVQELLKKADVHPALESGCISCHDPHGSAHPKLLADDGPAICFACHDGIGEKVAKSPVVHAALKSEKGCASCHSPHASDNPKLLVIPEKDTCVGCHKTVIAASMTTLHGPIKDGKCTPCHDPHGGSSGKLLVAEFPSGPYVPYTDTEYALCFSCHKRELLQYPDTSFATGFRDGERNLHYVHVNDKRKGRSCALCHSLHGSSQPKMMAVSVPFGTWSLPLKFVKTETGGSCSPGCHETKRYDRKTPVKKP